MPLRLNGYNFMSLSLSLSLSFSLSLSVHVMKEYTGETKEKEGEFDDMANSGGMAQKDFIFIRLPVLREVSLANVCVYQYTCYVKLLCCSIWSDSSALMVCLFLLIWR